MSQLYGTSKKGIRRLVQEICTMQRETGTAIKAVNNQSTMADPFTAQQFIQLGFEIRGFTKHQKLKHETKLKKFRSLFGISPSIMAAVWEHLRMAADQQIVISKYCKPIHLLLLYRWLKSYESFDELETDFNLCVNTIRKWVGKVSTKVALLRRLLVGFFCCS